MSGEKINNIIYALIHGVISYLSYEAGLESLQPNPVKKIKTFFVKKSELFDPEISFCWFLGTKNLTKLKSGEFSDFRKMF